VSAGGGHFVSGELKMDYNAALDNVSADFPQDITNTHEILCMGSLLKVH
jgi:hypothetical protein